jgi:sialate O-acetylesterase
VLAKVVPNALFTDHAVLQQGVAIPLWGSDPGEADTVSLEAETQKTKADRKGSWSVKLASRDAGGLHTLTMEAETKVVLSNVLIGEVWVCSEQSNMQWTVRRSNKAATEIASADWPNIQLFTVKRTVSDVPLTDVEGSQSECSPETVPTS